MIAQPYAEVVLHGSGIVTVINLLFVDAYRIIDVISIDGVVELLPTFAFR